MKKTKAKQDSYADEVSESKLIWHDLENLQKMFIILSLKTAEGTPNPAVTPYPWRNRASTSPTASVLPPVSRFSISRWLPAGDDQLPQERAKVTNGSENSKPKRLRAVISSFFAPFAKTCVSAELHLSLELIFEKIFSKHFKVLSEISFGLQSRDGSLSRVTRSLSSALPCSTIFPSGWNRNSTLIKMQSKLISAQQKRLIYTFTCPLCRSKRFSTDVCSTGSLFTRSFHGLLQITPATIVHLCFHLHRDELIALLGRLQKQTQHTAMANLENPELKFKNAKKNESFSQETLNFQTFNL
nr:hypothetical protein Iba_chr15aCG3530 [Ipomoea batatas]